MQETPTSRAASPSGRVRLALGHAPRPLWPLKLSQPGEIGSTGCGLHPPGDLRFRQPEHILIAAGVHRTFLITIGPVRQRDARPFHP